MNMKLLFANVSDGAVTARGCSTTDKIFHVECENHVMGRTVRTIEKFCYCSYSLCNSEGGRIHVGSALLLAVTILVL